MADIWMGISFAMRCLVFFLTVIVIIVLIRGTSESVSLLFRVAASTVSVVSTPLVHGHSCCSWGSSTCFCDTPVVLMDSSTPVYDTPVFFMDSSTPVFDHLHSCQHSCLLLLQHSQDSCFLSARHFLSPHRVPFTPVLNDEILRP